MRYKYQRIIRWLPLTILLAACTSSVGTVGDGDTSLRTLQPCAPPCWQGITPGQSNAADVRRILPTLPFIQSGSIEEQPYPEGNGSAFSWFYLHPGGFGSILLLDDRVSTIEARPGFQLELGEVVERFGSPERFYPANVRGPDGGFYIVSLYYPGEGLVFFTSRLPQLPLDATEYTVSPNFLVDKVVYLEPGTFEEVIHRLTPGAEELFIKDSLPWKGFGTFAGILPPSP